MSCTSYLLAARDAAVSVMFIASALTCGTSAGATQAPTSPDGSAKVTLFASEPQIVTPIGATVDSRGRLLVIESNSHFRPKNYQGPATDRIRILEDPNATGKATRFTTYFEGENFLMNLGADRDGSVVVSSRNEIFRLTDSDPKGRASANRKTTLARLETTADYPHNGLDGLTIDGAGNVYFGIGENSGQPWKLVGADGQTLHDDKGTGCIFRVDSQGRGLQLVARGLWNPFGLGLGPQGTIWAVDNDPDGRPPSRLLNVVPGADFGFEYRYGRTGMHPLQAWDGELPGTIGMVSGVGEGPCAVHWHEGRLLVSSWRDHQIESYTLKPRGATFTATMQPVLTGGQDFRPVALAFGPDGTLFVTDWGSESYEINHKGRVWKVTLAPAASPNAPVFDSDAARRARQLRQSNDVVELTAALADPDAAIRQAAQFGLSGRSAVEKMRLQSLASPEQRIGVLAALLWRGSDVRGYVDDALKDPDARVREMGVRLVCERQIRDARAEVERMLDSPVTSPRLLGMIVAAMSQLDGDPAARVNSTRMAHLLIDKLRSPGTSDGTRAALLRLLPADRDGAPLDLLRDLLGSAAPALRLEAIRSISQSADPARFPLLAEVAGSSRYVEIIRAEAIVGLGADPARFVKLLMELAQGHSTIVRQEALRSLRPEATKLGDAQRGALQRDASDHPEDLDLVNRLLGRAPAPRPQESDLAGWQKIIDQAPGDPEAGRRIFFHPSGPACYRCHVFDGRGRAVGPDLTMIGRSQDRSHILESILDPSREIAPLYTLWSVTTKSGQKIDGILLRRDGQENEVYVDASGQETKVAASDVVDRKIRKESLMPAGLVQALSDQELRDLMALLGGNTQAKQPQPSTGR